MEVVNDMSEIKINKGDYYLKTIVNEGDPCTVTVIPKKLIEEVMDCLKEYGESFNIVDDEENKDDGLDENVLWILNIIANASEHGVKSYKVVLKKEKST